MNTGKYLARINFPGKPVPDLKNLKKLHRLHLYNIPFENLDIHYNRKIILKTDLLYKKIVEEKRGGFCYELNGLFFFLLKETGYNADIISARVKKKKGGYNNEYDHLAIIVHLEEDWLVDVGFGDSFVEQLKFKLNIEQKENDSFFKVVKHDERYFRLMRCDKNDYEDQYIFSLTPRILSDFEDMCNYHQTSPESSFTQKRICSLATGYGRITLSEKNLIITKNGSRKEIQLRNEEKFHEKLLEYFNITLKS